MPSHNLHPLDAVHGFRCSQQVFCNAKQADVYTSALLARMLWSLSRCFPNLKIILQIRPSVFQVQLEADGYFFAQDFFCVCVHSKQGELVPTHDFWIWFYKSDFKNDCWASPKPDIQHKIAPTAYLSRRWTNKFLVEKIVSEKSSLIHSILQETGTITSGFEGKKRKYHFLKNRAILWYALSRAVHKNRTSQVRFSPSKPDLIRPKNTYLIVIGFLQAFIEPW